MIRPLPLAWVLCLSACGKSDQAPPPGPPLGYLCQLPAQTGESVCNDRPFDPDEFPIFMDAVMSAQDSAEENGFVKGGLVVDDLAYTSEVTRILRVSGYCAINSPTGVEVKNGNAWSERYSIVTPRHVPHTMYSARCKPARF